LLRLARTPPRYLVVTLDTPQASFGHTADFARYECGKGGSVPIAVFGSRGRLVRMPRPGCALAERLLRAEVVFS
jgi:hypothetical protein